MAITMISIVLQVIELKEKNLSAESNKSESYSDKVHIDS